MTIFDSIKYPISDPPTEEQLAALPGEVYNEWAEELGYRCPLPERVAVLLMRTMKRQPCNQAFYVARLLDLRKRISCLDE
jgi:hypothetical protein